MIEAKSWQTKWNWLRKIEQGACLLHLAINWRVLNEVILLKRKCASPVDGLELTPADPTRPGSITEVWKVLTKRLPEEAATDPGGSGGKIEVAKDAWETISNAYEEVK